MEGRPCAGLIVYQKNTVVYSGFRSNVISLSLDNVKSLNHLNIENHYFLFVVDKQLCSTTN